MRKDPEVLEMLYEYGFITKAVLSNVHSVGTHT